MEDYKGPSPKQNVIARLEFELTYNHIAVQHLSLYIMETIPRTCNRKYIYTLNDWGHG